MIYSDETMNQPVTPFGLRHIFQTEKPLLYALGAVALMRMIAIIATPLEFGVDEAQYWLWGQQLDFGYYSKPPLIGWFTGMMDALFGASAIAARLLTPLLHLVIALVLMISLAAITAYRLADGLPYYGQVCRLSLLAAL